MPALLLSSGRLAASGFSGLLKLLHATVLCLETWDSQGLSGESLEGGCSMMFLALPSEIAVAIYLPSLPFMLCNLFFKWQWLFSLG